VHRVSVFRKNLRQKRKQAMNRPLAAPAVALGAVLVFAPASGAADAEGWQYEFTPYLLMAGLDGTVGLQGRTADIDASFSDLWDSLEAGFMGIFEARNGPWMLGLEGVYMKLGTDGAFDITGPGGNVSAGVDLDVESTMTIWQGSVGYRVIDEVTKLDLIGAVRYTKLELDIDVAVTAPPPFEGGARSASGSESWTDLVGGVRVLHPVSDNVTLAGYADIGGGGSDLTYQFIAGVNWALSDMFVAKAGYRYLYWDYEDGGTVWDVAASGPYLGLGIRF
jgi:opacity protein-like surface antigen